MAAIKITEATVTLTIDDTEVTVPKGTTVLDAAKAMGIEIPTLCTHEILEPIGACRMCIVEIQPGPPRPSASCTTPAGDGMVVKTNSDSLRQARQQTMELLLQHHPLDCPYCDQSGTCDLQDTTFEMNIWKSPYETVSKAHPEEILNEVIMINHNRCILCYACVRVCDEQMGVHALDVVQRGEASFIASAQHKFMDCEKCGMCIEVCPVGAVLSRPFKHEARAWQTVQTETTCPHCSVGCKVQLESRKGRVLRARVRPVQEPNRGIACGKGFFGWEFVNSPDRITEPMIRRDGELTPVSWAEALKYTAERLRTIVDEHGPASVAAIGSGELTVEDNYSLQRLVRGVLGSNNIYLGRNGYEQAARVVFHTLGSRALTHEQDDILNAGAVLVIGADINGTHNVLAAHLKASARAGKTRLLIATRMGSGLDPFAEVKARVRPGSEATLLAAIAGDDVDASATGVEAETIARIREILDEVDDSVIVWDTGIWTYGREREIAGAAANLALATGTTAPILLPEKANLVGAMSAGMAPDLLPGPTRIEDDGARARVGSAWGVEIAAEPGPKLADLLAGGKLKALYVMGDDPVGTAADPAATRAALEAAELVIVQDIFPSATTELADVVLPGTTVAEKDGHFYNFEGRRMEIKAAAPPVGESRQDWEIPARLAAELGSDYGFRKADDLWNEFNEIAVAAELEGSKERQAVASAAPAVNGDHPYLLATETDLFTAGGALRRGKTMAELYPAVLRISAGDAERLALKDGDRVEVGTGESKLELLAQVSAAVPDGVVYLPDYLAEAPARDLRPERPDAVPVSIKRVGGSD